MRQHHHRERAFWRSRCRGPKIGRPSQRSVTAPECYCQSETRRTPTLDASEDRAPGPRFSAEHPFGLRWPQGISALGGLRPERSPADGWRLAGPVDDLDGLRDTGRLQSALQGDFKVSRRRTSRQRQDARTASCPAIAHDGDCLLSRQGSQRTSQLLCKRRKLAGLAPANGHDQLGMVLVERLSRRVIPLGARGGQGTF